jgi:hypothetical protein
MYHLEETHLRSCILLGVLILTPAVFQAADQPFDVKLGLWDFATTVQMSGAPPIPNLDKMPPEQRARIESAMKGMMGSPRTTNVKSCVTKAGIDEAIARANSNNGNKCDPKITSMTASKVELHMDCSDTQQMKSTGEITIERESSDRIKGNGSIKTVSNGRSMDTKWTMTGTFVSSDCGDLKPSGNQ